MCGKEEWPREKLRRKFTELVLADTATWSLEFEAALADGAAYNRSFQPWRMLSSFINLRTGFKPSSIWLKLETSFSMWCAFSR
jgi:hypothetical protein